MYVFKHLERVHKTVSSSYCWIACRIGNREKQLCIILAMGINKKLKIETRTVKVEYTFSRYY